MYAADHYQAARDLLARAETYADDDGLIPPVVAHGLLAAAQVHATLAQVAITAENLSNDAVRRNWIEVLAEPADARAA